MALIKCPKCGKEISDKAEKCIKCGYLLNQEKKSKKIETIKKQHIPPLTIKNIVFTIIFIILIYTLGTVNTYHSGTYSLMHIFKWIFNGLIGFDPILFTSMEIFIWIYLTFCIFLTNKNHNTRKFAKAGYIVIFIVELLSILVLSVFEYHVNMYYVVLLALTVAWIIMLYQEPNKEPKKSKNNLSVVEELEKLKKLLDNGAISKEEYEKLKQKIIEKGV